VETLWAPKGLALKSSGASGAPRGSFTLPIRGILKSANVIIVLQVGLSAYSRHLSYIAFPTLLIRMQDI